MTELKEIREPATVIWAGSGVFFTDETQDAVAVRIERADAARQRFVSVETVTGPVLLAVDQIRSIHTR